MEPRTRVALGVVVAGVLAVLPHVWVLDVLPQSLDAVRWIVGGDPASPGFVGWTFGSPHFRVGFRPLLGLSYTLTGLVGGASPWAHRALDLLAHGACVALTAGVALRLRSPRAPAWGAWAAAAVVALHPVVWFVVPHLARRAYPLVSLWILLAMLAVPRKGEAPVRWGVALAASAVAALTHEAGYAAFGLIVVVAGLHHGRDLRRLGPIAGAAAALGAGLLTWRSVVMAGIGGYRSTPASAASVARATLEAVFPVSGIRMDGDPAPSVVGLVVALGLLLAIGALAVLGRERGPVMAVGAVWMGALLVLFVPQGVWFLRQTYLLLPALGLVVGGLVSSERRLEVGVGAVLLGLVVARSALWTGGAPGTQAAWERGSRITQELADAVAAVPDDAHVAAAVPFVTSPTPWGLRARDAEARGALPRSARASLEWAVWQHPRRIQLAAVGLVAPHDPAPWFRLDGEVVRPIGDTEVVEPRRASERSGARWWLVHDGTKPELVPPRRSP